MKSTILLADNKAEDLRKWSKLLKDEGYAVFLADTPQKAHEALKNSKIDLAVIDIRLKDDDLETDYSGLQLAAEQPFRHIPKIILSAFTISYEQQRKVWEAIGGEPPAVVAFVGKAEGPENFIQEIHQAFEIWPHLSRLASTVSERIDSDHDNIRSQARQNYWVSMIFSILGFLIIVTGIVLASVNTLVEIGIVGTATGLILEALGYLFFRQLENANRRMDFYHQQLLQTYGIEFLLAIAARLPAEQENACIERIISAVLNSWYPAGIRPESFSIAGTCPNGKKVSLKEALESLGIKE